MTGKIVAWSLFSLVAWGGYQFYDTYQNPWTVPAITGPTVVDLLPPAHSGCTKDCE